MPIWPLSLNQNFADRNLSKKGVICSLLTCKDSNHLVILKQKKFKNQPVTVFKYELQLNHVFVNAD